jgi:hypothetical protein
MGSRWNHPFTLGSRPSLVVVSDLSVGIPFTMGLGYNLLLSRPFRWESLLRWDLSYNLLSQAFRWESLLRWDLGLHGAFGYQGASFSKHFFLFFSLVYHRALLRFFSHGGTQAITEPFSWIFLSLNGTQVITEPFSRTFLSLNGT